MESDHCCVRRERKKLGKGKLGGDREGAVKEGDKRRERRGRDSPGSLRERGVKMRERQRER